MGSKSIRTSESDRMDLAIAELALNSDRPFRSLGGAVHSAWFADFSAPRRASDPEKMALGLIPGSSAESREIEKGILGYCAFSVDCGKLGHRCAAVVVRIDDALTHWPDSSSDCFLYSPLIIDGIGPGMELFGSDYRAFNRSSGSGGILSGSYSSHMSEMRFRLRNGPNRCRGLCVVGMKIQGACRWFVSVGAAWDLLGWSSEESMASGAKIDLSALNSVSECIDAMSEADVRGIGFGAEIKEFASAPRDPREGELRYCPPMPESFGSLAEALALAADVAGMGPEEKASLIVGQSI
jgi:hypothetical protein